MMIGFSAEQMVIIRAGPQGAEKIIPQHTGIPGNIPRFQHIAVGIGADRQQFQEFSHP